MELGVDPARYGLLQSIVDEESYARSINRFREEHILLPTFSQLADPTTIPEKINDALLHIDPNEAHPLNLFRVHWYNAYGSSGKVDIPQHIVLPSELTGVEAKIVLAFGNRFPMITAHKVLAAYSCFVPRVISGQFDPTKHRAIWPSTGNYARGGIAISTLMRSRGVAVLPENMSQERFDWLDKWVMDPSDIVRTPGSESNVKEIYDACNELEKDKTNFIFNQFSEFANHIGHYTVTGRALGHIFETLKASDPNLKLAAFASASGSAGTLAAGDRLKDDFGAKIIAVEALECPTMLYNGYGEHNIQGIGDKHIPLIHNVMNTDIVAGISDVSTDSLNLVFTTPEGKSYLESEHQIPNEIVENLCHFGFSSICNMLAAVKTAKKLNLGPNDVIITVATDGSELYESEKEHLLNSQYPDGFTSSHAAEIFETHLQSVTTDHLEELDEVGRNRIFNLGYYTWVEQQGVSIEDFDARRSQEFWKALHGMTPKWDEMITEFNTETGVTV
ncbi:MAG: pyridoxal-5'-phosphate-dependent protein subunit beta [Acidimicrobiaceae bacterium]|nr:pyridoxal-5'-phosphate-dependent protein subunit beta [Acidimicrobiaceae bacterium]